MSGETGWRAVAEADGWGDIDVHRVRAQAAESIAWALLDETMDTADREPSEEAYKAALATADRMLGLAAHRESLAETADRPAVVGDNAAQGRRYDLGARLRDVLADEPPLLAQIRADMGAGFPNELSERRGRTITGWVDRLHALLDPSETP